MAFLNEAGLSHFLEKLKEIFVKKEDVNNVFSWEDVYPIGSVYISHNSTSPSELFGGTWAQLTGRFLRAANDVGSGGADTITLSTNQMPKHYHDNPVGMINTITNASGTKISYSGTQGWWNIGKTPIGQVPAKPIRMYHCIKISTFGIELLKERRDI